MITYQSKNSWGRPLLIALVGSVAVGAGIWWWNGHSEGGPTTPVSSPASGATPSAVLASNQPALTTDTASMTAPAPAGATDFSPTIVSALGKATANKPQLKPEADKVLSYMRFQRDFERWQALEDTRDAPARHQLARGILDQLPDRLAKGEFSMSEALMMATVLMSDLEPNEQKREQMVDDWGKKMALAVPQPTDDTQIQEQQKRVESLRVVPEMLTSNPQDPKLEQALTERSRLSR